MNNVAAHRLSRWLDNPPSDFTAQDVTDLAALLEERRQDTALVMEVVDAAPIFLTTDRLNAAVAALYTQFLGRILLAESNDH